ncbi:ABC transporter ATP-binding protein [Thalassotalea marina]|uniref:ABC transporter domain-containing protein n=1 Tax=Thalassotalea marina TaxID=1673741 RepID=A0A919BGT9_9GAMM|nr:ABC transporter ATP-binding protein [Thalassotalea marina]GHF89331.1 hypothetical protein GCM10017161_16460 [Thalassotalea marina]
MTDYIIESQGLTKCFGTKTALFDFNLAIPRGGIHAFIGANGAGKSTFFRLLLGLESPTQGSCSVLGINSQELSPEHRGKIGYVNEEHTLPSWMTVDAVIEMQRSLYPKWQQDTFDKVIANFDVGLKQNVGQLSRGERAGLNLSMALAQSPEVLILDEPTLGLDVVAKQAFLTALMHTEMDANCTIIYCSHQMEEVERVADNLIIVEAGEVKYMAAPDDFCQRVNYWICDFETKPDKVKNLQCVLSLKNIEGQIHIVTIDQPAEHFEAYLLANGAASVVAVPVSLDKAIGAVLAQNHRGHELSA